MSTLLSVIASSLPQPKYIKGSGEWIGPCPFCGGDDRFTIFPDNGPSGFWLCRKAANPRCSVKISAKNGYGCGDGIYLVRELCKVGYREACSMLGIEPSGGVSFRRGYGRGVSSGRSSLQVPQTQQAAPQPLKQPRAFVPPSEQWRAQAKALVLRSVETLRNSADGIMHVCGRRYLDARIFSTDLVGWIEQHEFPLRSAWGLPDKVTKDANGNEKVTKKLRIPRGILLASIRNCEVASIVIRRPTEEVPEGEKRFYEIPGGADVPFMIGAAGQPVVLCESALDACLIWDQSGGTVSAVAVNGAGKSRDEEVDAFIQQAKLVLIVPDNDKTGHKTWHQWRAWYPQAVLEPVPKYVKDPGDLQKYRFQNLSVREIPTVDMWLQAAIEHAAKVRGVTLA